LYTSCVPGLRPSVLFNEFLSKKKKKNWIVLFFFFLIGGPSK